MFRYLFFNTITSFRTNGTVIKEISGCVTYYQNSEPYDDRPVCNWNHWSINFIIVGLIKRIKIGVHCKHVCLLDLDFIIN